MRRCRLAVGALGVLALLLAPAGAYAQSQPAPDAAVILVVDASKSMTADDGSGRPKMAAAKAALNTLVDELPDDAKVGLRIYGSEVSGTGEAEGCADTKLVSLVAPLALSASTYMLDADEAPGQSGPYPVELSVRVSGKVIGEPASSKDSEDAPSSDVGSSADEGTSDLVLAAGGAGGILVGVLAGGAAAGLGRRRPA